MLKFTYLSKKKYRNTNHSSRLNFSYRLITVIPVIVIALGTSEVVLSAVFFNRPVQDGIFKSHMLTEQLEIRLGVQNLADGY